MLGFLGRVRRAAASTSSRIDGLKFKIKIATASGLVLYATLFAYLLSPEWVLANFTLLRVVIWALAIAFAGYLAIGNLHNWLDKTFFHEREKVDQDIRDRLTKPYRDVLCQRAVSNGIVASERSSLMNLFYTFVLADDTERERAFSYFADYFISVNLSLMSIVGAVGAICVAAIIPLERLDRRLVFIIVTIVLPFILNFLRTVTRRRLLLPGKAQTARILSDEVETLKARLPNYRVYRESESCTESGRCPLVAGGS